LTGGNCTINANQAGNSNYNAASQVQQTFTVNKANQTITFNPSATTTYGATPLNLTPYATGGASGNPVTFAVTSGPGSITGTTLTITGAGPIVVTASQAGNANYNAAADVPKTISVAAATLTVTAVAKSKTYGAADPALTYNATGFVNSDTLSIMTGNLSRAAGETVAGSPYAILQGTLTGGSNYQITYVGANLTITKASQTITVGTHAPANAGYYTQFTIAATVSSGLTVTYSSGSPSICTNVGATFTMISGTGTCVVQYDQGGDANYTSAIRLTENTTTVPPDGILKGSGIVDVIDALKALRIAAGLDTPTASDIAHGDVAPLVNGIRTPDAKIDLNDVVAILRKAVGLSSW
jgi:hypothetical protein